MSVHVLLVRREVVRLTVELVWHTLSLFLREPFQLGLRGPLCLRLRESFLCVYVRRLSLRMWL